MCINCIMKAIVETAVEEATGAKFEDKLIGIASPEAIAQIKDARDEADKLDEQRKAEIRAINEKYKPLKQAAEDKRQEGWKAAFVSVGLPADTDGDYTVNVQTGEVTISDLNMPNGADPEAKQEAPLQ